MNNLPLDEFLGMLKGVRRTGDERWMALCPSHDDRAPSLSVGSGDDGRILLHDFGGCETREVVEAIGIQFAQLFPSAPAYQRTRRARSDRAPPPPTPPTPARTEEEIPGARVEEELLALARLILGGPAALARVPAGFDAQQLRVEGIRAVYRAAVALAAEGPHWPCGFPPYALARAAPAGDGPTVVSWSRFALRMRLALREGRS